MTIEEMKDKKKEKGYSYEQMADLSGIPLGTIHFQEKLRAHVMILL